MDTDTQIVIVGGGFAGIGCALRLAQYDLAHTKIRLISNNPNFEYHAALYRVVTGKSPMEVCLPLAEIFKKYRNVEIVEDTITSIDLKEKTMCGESTCDYHFDTLVLGLGSETVYYDIPGLKELSFGFKTIHEAIELKRHLQKTFSACRAADKDNQMCGTHIVVVGGGPSGTELAAELAIYADKLAAAHGIDPSLVSVDLIHSPNRLVPQASKKISAAIEEKIRSLGVNVFLNQKVVKEDVEQVYLKDMELKAKTVVWTAGVKANALYSKVQGLEVDKNGRVIVDMHLRAQGNDDIFVVGDGAAIPDAGLGQSALSMGRHVAEEIALASLGIVSDEYIPKSWILAVPVGPGWAAVEWGFLRAYGKVGWFLRRLLDFYVFLQFLPIHKAIQALRMGRVEWESGLDESE